MSFDATLPSNSTKIRNYPTVLNNNFASVEEGDITLRYWQINFAERDSVPGAPPPAVDPVREDDTMIIFSKQNADSRTDLFVLDDRGPANNFQITQDGSLGSTSTPLNASNISFDVDSTTGLTYVDGQLITAYGQFSNAGVLSFGKNMATAGTPHPSVGLFNLSVDADVLQNSSYLVSGVVSRAGDSGGSIRGVMPLLTPAPVVSMATIVQVEIKRDGGRTDTFDYFNIMICGGR